MGVLFQAFYWNCPEKADMEFKWWDYVKSHVDELADAGFTALWLPPPSKGVTQRSMGYEPYDHFDLGEFKQRGGIPTWYGTKQSLIELICEAHEMNMQVYVDLAINNANGGTEELNEYSGQMTETHFEPASKKFPRDWRCFHPSKYEFWEGATWDDLPTYCHQNPYVYEQFLTFSRMLIEDIGFDGFCFDLIEGYGTWLAKAILNQQYERKGYERSVIRPFGMAHAWGPGDNTEFWLTEFNRLSNISLSVFDVPLRYRLKSFCDVFGSKIPTLLEPGTLSHKNAFNSVTFVDNHLFVDEAYPQIFNDKMLAYAFILTHPGYPCVYWEDYFERGMALPGQVSGIQALVRCHEEYANGQAAVRHLGQDLYVMERVGIGNMPGLLLVINNRGDRWQGAWVQTSKPNTRFTPIAWRGKDDLNPPAETLTHDAGHGHFWAPPRGYTVYIPK